MLNKIPNWFNRNKDYLDKARTFANVIKNATNLTDLSLFMCDLENFIEEFNNKEFSRLPVKAANAIANYVDSDTVAGTVIGVAAAAKGVATSALIAGPVGAAVTGTAAGLCGVAKVYSNAKNKGKEDINQILVEVNQTRKNIIEFDKEMQMKQKTRKKMIKKKKMINSILKLKVYKIFKKNLIQL